MVGLRIGLVTAFPPGKNSLNEFGWHTAKDLADKDEVEEVLLFADHTDAGEPTPLEKVTPIPCWTFNSLSNLFNLATKIRKTKPDAVVFNLQFATFGDTKIAGGLGLLAPALTKALGIPTGVILHNLVENVDMEDAGFASNKWIARGLTFAGRLLTKSILRADYVALTIPRYVEFLRDSYNADNVVLTPHGAFEHLPQPDYETPSDTRKLLAFGKWGTYKTVDTLIDAYRLLRMKPGFEDVQVVIAGTDSPNIPGYLEGAAERCRDLPGVIFTGYVEEDDVAELFTSCTTTVFPYTSTTGSSGVLHQAGSYGCSAILPEIGDFAEVIEEEGFIGQYFEPGSAKSLAAAIEELLVNKELRAEMGRRNFAAASTIPFAEVLDWHLLHLEPLIKAKSGVDG